MFTVTQYVHDFCRGATGRISWGGFAVTAGVQGSSLSGRYEITQNRGKLRCSLVNWQRGLFLCRELTESAKGASMAKRRGNPNWGKPEPIGPVVPTVTSFELVVKEYKLTPDQYVRSTRLREWARRNKNSKYIPEALLEAWGFEIESTL